MTVFVNAGRRGTYDTWQGCRGYLDGQVVMFGGALGDNIKLKVADASAEGFLPRWILGIATHSIDQNKWGYVTKVGKVRGVNTTAFAEGAVVYFDPTTPGGLTATQPEAPCCKGTDGSNPS